MALWYRAELGPLHTAGVGSIPIFPSDHHRMHDLLSMRNYHGQSIRAEAVSWLRVQRLKRPWLACKAWTTLTMNHELLSPNSHQVGTS